jgi:hypothetical protein
MPADNSNSPLGGELPLTGVYFFIEFSHLRDVLRFGVLLMAVLKSRFDASPTQIPH